MKTYVITLERNSERNKHIKRHIIERNLDHKIIPAVDGALLTDKDLQKSCNMEKVNKLRWWLTNGAIGCALSHLKAYEEFLSSHEKAAFIIEDDAVLPKNINELLAELEGSIQTDEIVLLYYTSFKPAKLTSYRSEELKNGGGLYYPMDIGQPITATAYVIGRGAALKLSETIKPIEVTADCWHHFYSRGAIQSLRVHYPSLVTTKNFKSSIDYLKNDSHLQTILSYINKYKIPFLYQFLNSRRKRRLNKMLNQFSFCDEVSPYIIQKAKNG